MTGTGIGISYITSSTPIWALRIEQCLSSAAVGLVALAGFRLASNIVKDRLQKILLLISAGLAICYSAPWLYPVLMVFGGVVTYTFDSVLAPREQMKMVMKKEEEKEKKKEEEKEERKEDEAEAKTATEVEVRSEAEADPQLRQRGSTSNDNSADEEKALDEVIKVCILYSVSLTVIYM